jgi:hypothetical protein
MTIYESTRSSARTSDKILPRNMCIKRTTGEHSSQGILHIDRPNPPLIGRKDEKLANAASYVKVIVKQGLGRLKTLRCTEHVRGATHTSMALVWADSAAPRFVTLNNGSRWVPSGATRHSKHRRSVLYIMLPISPCHLLRIWHRLGIASLERGKVQHNDKRRLEESDQHPQDGEGVASSSSRVTFRQTLPLGVNRRRKAGR